MLPSRSFDWLTTVQAGIRWPENTRTSTQVLPSAPFDGWLMPMASSRQMRRTGMATGQYHSAAHLSQYRDAD